MANVMQNRENNLNFISNFSEDNQIPKMSPIQSGEVLIFIFLLMYELCNI